MPSFLVVGRSGDSVSHLISLAKSVVIRTDGVDDSSCILKKVLMSALICRMTPLPHRCVARVVAIFLASFLALFSAELTGFRTPMVSGDCDC